MVYDIGLLERSVDCLVIPGYHIYNEFILNYYAICGHAGCKRTLPENTELGV